MHLLLGDNQEAIEACHDAAEHAAMLTVELVGPELLSELGTIHRNLCSAQYNLELPDVAIDAAQSAIEYSQQFLEVALGPIALTELAAALRLLGMSYEISGNVSKAGESYRLAVGLFDEIETDLDSYDKVDGDKTRIGMSQCLDSLAVHEKANGNNELAELHYRRSTVLLEPVIEHHPSRIDLQFQLARTATNLGNLEFSTRRYAEAANCYQRSAAITRKLVDDFPQTFRFHELHLLASSGLGVAQKNLLQIDQAIATMQECIELTERNVQSFGSNSRIQGNLAKLYGNLANIYLDIKKDIPAGEAASRKSTAISKSLVEQFPDIVAYRLTYSISLGRLASLLSDRGEQDEALQFMDIAFSEAQALLETNDQDPRYLSNIVWMLYGRAQVFSLIGDEQRAIESATAITELRPLDDTYWIKAAQCLAQGIISLRKAELPDSKKDSSIEQYLSVLTEFLIQADLQKKQDFPALFQTPPLSAIKDLPEMTPFTQQN